ncbi:MAG: hypothetical protein QG632_772 [Candidatus Dependentiae bacterium]|nr:hypothetical protein [Candidatus Dependentiae bacterium]
MNYFIIFTFFVCGLPAFARAGISDTSHVANYGVAGLIGGGALANLISMGSTAEKRSRLHQIFLGRHKGKTFLNRILRDAETNKAFTRLAASLAAPVVAYHILRSRKKSHFQQKTNALPEIISPNLEISSTISTPVTQARQEQTLPSENVSHKLLYSPPTSPLAQHASSETREEEGDPVAADLLGKFNELNTQLQDTNRTMPIAFYKEINLLPWEQNYVEMLKDLTQLHSVKIKMCLELIENTVPLLKKNIRSLRIQRTIFDALTTIGEEISLNFNKDTLLIFRYFRLLDEIINTAIIDKYSAVAVQSISKIALQHPSTQPAAINLIFSYLSRNPSENIAAASAAAITKLFPTNKVQIESNLTKLSNVHLITDHKKGILIDLYGQVALTDISLAKKMLTTLNIFFNKHFERRNGSLYIPYNCHQSIAVALQRIAERYKTDLAAEMREMINTNWAENPETALTFLSVAAGPCLNTSELEDYFASIIASKGGCIAARGALCEIINLCPQKRDSFWTTLSGAWQRNINSYHFAEALAHLGKEDPNYAQSYLNQAAVINHSVSNSDTDLIPIKVSITENSLEIALRYPALTEQCLDLIEQALPKIRLQDKMIAALKEIGTNPELTTMQIHQKCFNVLLKYCQNRHLSILPSKEIIRALKAIYAAHPESSMHFKDLLQNILRDSARNSDNRQNFGQKACAIKILSIFDGTYAETKIAALAPRNEKIRTFGLRALHHLAVKNKTDLQDFFTITKNILANIGSTIISDEPNENPEPEQHTDLASAYRGTLLTLAKIARDHEQYRAEVSDVIMSIRRGELKDNSFVQNAAIEALSVMGEQETCIQAIPSRIDFFMQKQSIPSTIPHTIGLIWQKNKSLVNECLELLKKLATAQDTITRERAMIELKKLGTSRHEYKAEIISFILHEGLWTQNPYLATELISQYIDYCINSDCFFEEQKGQYIEKELITECRKTLLTIAESEDKDCRILAKKTLRNLSQASLLRSRLRRLKIRVPEAIIGQILSYL